MHHHSLATALLSTLALAPFAPAQSAASLVLDVNPGSAGSRPTWLLDVAGTLFFSADDGVHGGELWRSDSTAAGTAMVVDLNPGASASNPTRPYDWRGTLVYAGSDGVLGHELVISDGTAAGTRVIRDIDPGSGGSQIDGFLEMGGALYFRGWPQSLGGELWRTDGTSLGTYMVRDIHSGGTGLLFGPRAGSSGAAVLNDALLFSPTDGVIGYELWRSGGTAASTQLLLDINPNGASQPSFFARLGNRVVFFADDGMNGAEPWVTDGTAAGTQLVVNIAPGAAGSRPRFLAILNGVAYFDFDDGTTGRELWRTDGTAGGTSLVLDIRPGATGSEMRGLVAVGGKLFLGADDGQSGYELWVSDGTPSGTARVADINPGSANAFTAPTFVQVGERSLVVFGADDGQSGSEPWLSDGTAMGTRRLADVNPGSASSQPASFAVSGHDIFFAADDGTHGVELWAAPIPPIQAPIAKTYGRGCPGTGGLVPEIGVSGLPVVGNMQFAITGANVFPVVATGFPMGALLISASRSRVGVGLGCTGWIGDPIFAAGRSFFSSTARITIPITTSPSVVGVEVFCQWAILDLGATNGVFSASEGLQVLVGR
jgi:ELWxxDGT repeat protein